MAGNCSPAIRKTHIKADFIVQGKSTYEKTILMTILASSLLLTTDFACADSIVRCSLKNGSQIYLDFHGVGVSYTHYNKAGDIDLRLPARAYGHFAGMGVNMTTYYRFINGDYSYVVISVDQKGYVWDGLTVYKGKKLISQQQCKTSLDGYMPEPSPDNGTIIDESDTKEAETFSYTP